MTPDKKWRLVCYDICDPKRYRKVYKILRGHGTPVQYSIFRCRLDARETEQLRWKLAELMEPPDRLLIVDLCGACAASVVARNHVTGWTEEPPPFKIVSGHDHAPAGVSGPGLRKSHKAPKEGPTGSD